MSQPFVVLECAVQNYAWGKIGASSRVAQLVSAQSQTKNIPYAELWMGTHSSGPSYIASTNTTTNNDNNHHHHRQLLSEYLREPLPYLFKVLSVAQALSIQAHPDATLAKILHQSNPQAYRDDQHKPEMAIAITPFQVLCGFRSLQQISHFLENVPEFRAVVGNDIAQEFISVAYDENASSQQHKQVLKQLFNQVMKIETSHLNTHLASLITRIQKQNLLQNEEKKDTPTRDLAIYELIIRLNQQYPNDVGVFAPFYLNAFTLQPGESIFLGPNLPHAYLDGDCIECMACSDNVVRAGLTPKLRDVDTLVNMLTYESGAPAILNGDVVDQYTKRYSPPVDEFQLTATQLPRNTHNYTLPPVNSDAILLVYEGQGMITSDYAQITHTQTLSTGSILLIRAGVTVRLSSAAEQHLVGFRCYCPRDARSTL